MNKDTYMQYLKNIRYLLYDNFEGFTNELNDRIDLLISYYQKELKTKNAELEAKVYVYERIIANSNFAPILKANESEGE